jgi:hypothetical protein
MDKLKPNRKPTSSPESLDRIAMIISDNWAETWEIVQQRSQTKNLKSLPESTGCLTAYLGN